MDFAIDRGLPVSVSAQLRGLIEYRIACGELTPGERLPSVRELADSVGVAPMTVSKVYDELKRDGLIEGRVGSGTYVVDLGKPAPNPDHIGGELQRRTDRFIADCLRDGLRPGELVEFLKSRLARRDSDAAPKRIVFIGNVEAATRDYAESVAAALGPIATVEAMTFDDVRTAPTALRKANAADLIITFANRRREAMELAPGTDVVAISLIPSEATRRALASLDPLHRVLGVSVYPEFAATLNEALHRFAPHVSDIAITLRDAPEVVDMVRTFDVIVYGTGAERVLKHAPEGVVAFEFRHTPDAADLRRVVLPLIAPAHASR